MKICTEPLMQKIRKQALTGITVVLVFALLLSQSVYACTGVYIGPEASTDGTTIVARSNDNQSVWGNHLEIVGRVENESGRTMPVDSAGTVFAPLPATTFRYTATPWMDSTRKENGLQKDAAVCANEYGVSMSMSVTAFANSAALTADPLVATGLTEMTACDLVICQSKTAREALRLLLSLIDSYGSSESNIAFISDQNETWYVEMYTGHQYAAVRMPKDKVAVFGNEFNLVSLSEYEESVTSPELESLAKENGFAVYGEDNQLDLMATYSLPFFSYSHMRTWIGHQLLAPSAYKDDYEGKAVYPLVFQADKKVSLTDVFALIRNRYEGTEYCPDDTGRTDIRAIGTDTAMSVHVLQTYSGLPANLSVVTWESLAPAAYGVFVPFSNGSTAVSPVFGNNQPTEELGKFDTENYAYYLFKDLNTLCVLNAGVYGRPLQKYWAAVEEKTTEGMDWVLRQAGKDYARSEEDALEAVTAYCVSMQEAAFQDGQTLLNDLRWLMAQNSNTMRKGRNPETHELLEEDKPLTPFVPKGDLSLYDIAP